MNVTYEITATVADEHVADYETYMLDRHILDLLSTGCFASASFSTSGAGRYRIRYEAHDRKHLDRYLAEHAARTREDFELHFPSGVTIEREVWNVFRIFDL